MTISDKFDSLIVLDRKVDMITPLLTQLTYQGLIDEVVGIKNCTSHSSSPPPSPAPPRPSSHIIASSPRRSPRVAPQRACESSWPFDIAVRFYGSINGASPRPCEGKEEETSLDGRERPYSGGTSRSELRGRR